MWRQVERNEDEYKNCMNYYKKASQKVITLKGYTIDLIKWVNTFALTKVYLICFLNNFQKKYVG